MSNFRSNSPPPASPPAQENLPLDDINLGVQIRDVDHEIVATYADRLAAGDVFPPLVVFDDGATIYLADGFHRLAAHRAAGATTVPCEVHDGSLREARLYAAGANRAHGHRMNNAAKRSAVLVLLADDEWKTWSDRAIAEHVGVSHTFVANLRRETGNDCQSPDLRRTADGRMMDTSKIGKGKGKKGKTTKVAKVEQWRRGAKNLLASLPRGGHRRALLRAHFLAVYHELLKLEPDLAKVAEPDADDETPFALAAAAAVQKDKPLPESILRLHKPVKSPFTYAGGKTRVVGDLIETMGVLHRCGMYGQQVLREPFVGGGSVMLNMLKSGRAKQVWINDADRGVVAIWNAFIYDHKTLRDRVLDVKITDELVDEMWAALEANVLTGTDLALAELIVRQCNYRGYGRVVGSPRKNLTYRWRPRSMARRIEAAHRLLSDRVLHGECTNLDACEVIAAPGPCFIYADPPYVKAGPALYVQPFDDDKHRELAGALKATDQPWLLSYDDHPLVRELYAEQVITTIPVPRQNKPAEQELLICSARHPDILKSDGDPNYIEELFGLECEVESNSKGEASATSRDREKE